MSSKEYRLISFDSTKLILPGCYENAVVIALTRKNGTLWCGLVETHKGLTCPGGGTKGQPVLKAAMREFQEETTIGKCRSFQLKGERLWLDDKLEVKYIFEWKTKTCCIVGFLSTDNFEAVFNHLVDSSQLYEQSHQEVIAVHKMPLDQAISNSDTISYAKATLRIACELLNESTSSASQSISSSDRKGWQEQSWQKQDWQEQSWQKQGWQEQGWQKQGWQDWHDQQGRQSHSSHTSSKDSSHVHNNGSHKSHHRSSSHSGNQKKAESSHHTSSHSGSSHRTSSHGGSGHHSSSQSYCVPGFFPPGTFSYPGQEIRSQDLFRPPMRSSSQNAIIFTPQGMLTRML